MKIHNVLPSVHRYQIEKRPVLCYAVQGSLRLKPGVVWWRWCMVVGYCLVSSCRSTLSKKRKTIKYYLWFLKIFV